MMEKILNPLLSQLNPYQAQNLKLFVHGLLLSRSPPISRISFLLPIMVDSPKPPA